MGEAKKRGASSNERMLKLVRAARWEKFRDVFLAFGIAVVLIGLGRLFVQHPSLQRFALPITLIGLIAFAVMPIFVISCLKRPASEKVSDHRWRRNPDLGDGNDYESKHREIKARADYFTRM